MKLSDILKESYYQFRNSTKNRTNSEQLNRAVKEIKRKVVEVNTLVKYTERLKKELNEGGNMKYWKATNASLNKISEAINHLNNKIKNLIQ